MASSGSFNTSSYDSYPFPHYMTFTWSISKQEISNNRTLINWRIYGNGGSSGGWFQKNWQTRVFFGGTLEKQTTSAVDMTQGYTLLTGQKWINHSSTGAGSFSASADGRLDINAVNVSGGRSWTLPTIPRGATFSSTEPGTWSETDPLNLGINNPADKYIRIAIGTTTSGASTEWCVRNLGTPQGSVTITPTAAELAVLYAAHPNEKTFSVDVEMKTFNNSNYTSQLGNTVSYDAPFVIVNANPTFAGFNYKDGNSTTVALTGNDQVLVQNQSQLIAEIPPENKMVAVKSASPSKYTFQIDTLAVDEPYSTSIITKSVGSVANSGTKRLTVKAFDSRSYSTAKTADITVVPYSPPVVTATVERENGFEAQTAINISGSISPVTVGGTQKNSINTSTGVEYRYREANGTWNSWVFKDSTLTGVDITTVETLLSLDIEKEFEFQVRITDKLSTTTLTIPVTQGKPILWIGEDRAVGINHIPGSSAEGLHIQPGDALWDYIYPVGSRLTNTDSGFDPGTLYSGFWSSTGAGPYIWTRDS